MSNRTYVCVECRTSKRAEAAYGLVHHLRCTLCSKSLSELPWRRRIPKKDDNKGWKELASLIAKQEDEWIPRRNTLGIEKIAKIDKLLSSTKSEDKQKKLLYQRRTIEKQYNTEQGAAPN